jgi:hypothetical protein
VWIAKARQMSEELVSDANPKGTEKILYVKDY